MKNLWRMTSVICCHYLINYENDNKWFEIRNDQILFTFTIFKSMNDDVVLYDISRNMYLRISKNKIFYSYNQTSINIPVYNGEWILYQTKFFTHWWQSNNLESVFIKYVNNNTWYEMKNNRIVNSLFFIKSVDKDVILYNSNQFMFYRISSDGLYSGLKVNDISYKNFTGKWGYFELSN